MPQGVGPLSASSVHLSSCKAPTPPWYPNLTPPLALQPCLSRLCQGGSSTLWWPCSSSP